MSNLIKSTRYITLDEEKKIDIIPSEPREHEVEKEVHSNEEQKRILEQAAEEKIKVIASAREEANQLIKQAAEEAEQKKQQAELDLKRWLEEQKQLEKIRIKEQEQAGYHNGYESGVEQAKQHTKEKYAGFIQEAEEVLQLAYARKEEIIQESEPYVLELSVEIASKILRKTLDVEKEMMLEYMKTLLAHREEQITLSVAPEHFSYVTDFREELEAVVEAEARLLIVPDRRVKDHGCMIKTSFGTIDARFDSQLTEIKKGLLQAIHEGGDQNGSS